MDAANFINEIFIWLGPGAIMVIVSAIVIAIIVLIKSIKVKSEDKNQRPPDSANFG